MILLRRNELRTLKKSVLDFTNSTITVETGYSKHRSKDVLPLRADLAAELQRYLANKLPNSKVFSITDKTSLMIAADLLDAGIDYVDENGRYLDLHAVRHTFITNLSSVSSRIAQSLARHRSSAMTDRYTHIRLHDERAALETLPDLSFPSEGQQKATATGTEGKNLAENLAFLGGKQCTSMDNRGRITLDNDPKNRIFDRARQDSNLQPSDSKSVTLSY